MLDLILGQVSSRPTTMPVVSAELRTFIVNLAYLGAAACFIFGLKFLASPKSARRGNAIASFGMLVAVVATLFDERIMRGGALGIGTALVGLAVGGTIGALLALRVNMRGMPQMVSLLNGFGGLAAGMVGFGEYVREIWLGHPLGLDVRVSVAMSIVIGMITFTGSLIAWAKLEELKLKIWGMPLSGVVMFPMHRMMSLVAGVIILLLMVMLVGSDKAVWLAVVLLVLAAGYGKLFVLPIGGADMPVVIALLNSFSGLGAAATGFVLHNNALIIGGSLVGASGLILTMIMCKAMNRSLLNVLAGGFGGAPVASAGGGAQQPQGTIRKMDADEAAMVIDAAQNVIIVPGYGMAVAQAQHAVAELMSTLQKKGVNVKFAVHPVAGRMPGHMNVLLAEANVPYELLADLEINPEFTQCDVALVIGANDVVNPAARHDKASPIYGMPIFDCDKARTVMVCKRSMNPGFAGIENELFYLPNTVMLFGDAKATVAAIVKALKEA
jgi:NAD(P) transhydrogenase subunit beta